ncbi:hypothetical protein [Rhizobium sp. MHM7A]|uniref:hypothetical protein n=1 Tax=Rhizobium sp. MHM7A TaxID=2583233 RepID=UPI0011064BB7|nr:hypothetical protein [Rhizobium sp. MHM7A]TLX15755.1 hypothetical protein FFR93_00100 [Rhizobium sp. MHM7A]
MKMQIAFRETVTTRHDHNVAMAVGVIEVGPQDTTDYEDKSLVFRFDFNPALEHAVAASTHWPPRRLVDSWGWLETELETGTLEGLLMSQIERAIPNDIHNADFVLRQTEVPPSVEGGRVFAFSGFLHVKPEQRFSFNDVVWFESPTSGQDNVMIYAGRSGVERRLEDGRQDMVETTRGDAMSSFLRKPLWGFGDEAYSLPGTMRLSMYQKMDRYMELFFSESLSAADKKEFAGLKEEMRRAGLDNVAKDEDFKAFVKQMRLKYPELVGNKPLTGKQRRLHEEKVSEVMSEVMEADGFTRSFGR